MGSLGIGYGNLIDTSTLSGGSWTVGHPLTEIQTRELARYARSSTAAAADTQVIIDHGSAKAAQVFAAFAHTQEDAAATVTVTRGTTSGGVDVLDTGPLACWPFSPLDGDRNGSHFGIFVVAPASSTARYTKIAFSGSQVMRIGRLFVGPLFRPTYSPEYGKISHGWMPANSSVARTESGADWSATRTELRSEAIDFTALTDAAAESSVWHEIVRTHGVTGEVVFIPDVADRSETQQFGFLGLLAKLSALDPRFLGHGTSAVAINERGGAP